MRISSAPQRLLTALVLVCAAASLVVPAVASAAQIYAYGEGGDRSHPFTLEPQRGLATVDQAGVPKVTLTHVVLQTLDEGSPVWSGSDPDARTAVPLQNGHILVADRMGKFVAELDVTGSAVWSYRDGKDGYLPRPFSAQPCTYKGQDCVLISDRGACRVFMVAKASKQIVWQYGVTDGNGSGVDHLVDPFTATWVPGVGDGTVLIADNNGSSRVIEVRVDDYDPSQPDDGYTTDSIVWSYGTSGVSGTGVDQLMQPRSPQRLANGNTLIADAGGRRVIEVRTSDYRPGAANDGYDDRSIVWHYGGGNDSPLADPNMAFRPGNGATLIVDCGDIQGGIAPRIVWVDSSGAVGAVTETLVTQGLEPPTGPDAPDTSEPRTAYFDGENGSLVIADSGYKRVIRVGNEHSVTATSGALECGQPGMLKAFSRITLRPPVAGTSVDFDYRIDDKGDWRDCKPLVLGKFFSFPAGASGHTFAYRVTLTTNDSWTAPTLDGFSLQFTKATTGGSGGGGGADKPGGSGNSGSSGVYRYPATAAGGTGTYGTGTGSGSYGSGTGSGSSGTGAGSSGAGAGSSAAAGSLQPPVQSSGSGAPQAVQGYQTEGAQGVSGVPLRAEEGAQAPAPGHPGPPVPILAIIGAGLVVAAVFFVPWPFAAARIRAVAGFDHARPKYYRPFWPLGR